MIDALSSLDLTRFAAIRAPIVRSDRSARENPSESNLDTSFAPKHGLFSVEGAHVMLINRARRFEGAIYRMPIMRLPILAALALSTSGCTSTTVVQVMTLHHGTADDDGDYADNGDGDRRTFETDEGWRIHLTSGYVTTAGITLHDCDGNVANLQLFRGHVAEDLITQDDLDANGVGSLNVPPTDLCELTVHYGKFDPEESDFAPRSSAVEGTSVYLKGVAVQNDERFEFEVRVRKAIDVEIDMSEMVDGAPMRISGDEAFPIQIVISKTYDRFFDGIDFRTATDDDLEENVAAVLEEETSLQIET